ncbi:ABC transporter permease subunit [Prochlorococcus marinus]|uniref:ABC-type amino acid transport system, permease component n=1 Tax=Prochlorococcus marinus (strain MIT 9211) TaxID=93059 RepID=A9BC47_PROM4|nr:ABC transporter permease subunit [Prochlorococcus marinus]ABX09409.1 ABC-type amino acid transport system, permease component [Prochlorococcus marinus str. MIT 9211]
MERRKAIVLQGAICAGIFLILAILINNLSVNLLRAGLGINFGWLLRPAGFALAEHSLKYSPSDSYLWAIFMGWLNSLKVIFASLLIATIIGFLVGIARTGNNILIGLLSSAYVSLIRQIPLLLQLMFWYFVGFLSISNSFYPINNIVEISNQGLIFLGFNFSAEFSALLLGLSVFTGAYISEVVRGGIQSVAKGQWEAFRSLGLSETAGLYKVIMPQALPAILPGLTSQYLNLAKNSTLAIAVGYADIYAISDTVITQTGRAVEGFILLLTGFLFLNLIISNLMEIINTLILKFIKR